MESGRKERLAASARRLEQRAEITSRAHFQDAKRLDAVNRWLVTSAAMLAALAGVAAYVEFPFHSAVAAVVAFLAAGDGALSISLNAAERASQHHMAGVQYSEMEDRAREIWALRMHAADDDQNLADAYSQIMREYHLLSIAHPGTSDWAYRTVWRQLSQRESSIDEGT